jgi:hypothetical protein
LAKGGQAVKQCQGWNYFYLSPRNRMKLTFTQPQTTVSILKYL